MYVSATVLVLQVLVAITFVIESATSKISNPLTGLIVSIALLVAGYAPVLGVLYALSHTSVK